MASISPDTTNISDLPNNTQINQQIPVQQQSNITMSVSPQQQPPQQKPEPQQPQESFQAANTISEEEKSLVNKMTKIMEETLDEADEDEG